MGIMREWGKEIYTVTVSEKLKFTCKEMLVCKISTILIILYRSDLFKEAGEKDKDKR